MKPFNGSGPTFRPALVERVLGRGPSWGVSMNGYPPASIVGDLASAQRAAAKMNYERHTPHLRQLGLDGVDA